MGDMLEQIAKWSHDVMVISAKRCLADVRLYGSYCGVELFQLVKPSQSVRLHHHKLNHKCSLWKRSDLMLAPSDLSCETRQQLGPA